MASLPRAAEDSASSMEGDECKSPTAAHSPCTHARAIVNHGAPIDTSDPRLAFDGVNECDACGKGFLNWLCLGCLQTFCGRSTFKWLHKCGATCDEPHGLLTVDLAGLTVKCHECDRALDNDDIHSSPPLLRAMRALHTAKFGHQLMLQRATKRVVAGADLQDAVAGALGASASIDRKWRAFQDKFQAMLDNSVGAIAQALGADPHALNPTLLLNASKPDSPPTAAEKAAVFGDAEPSLERFAEGIRSGRFKDMVVVAGAGLSCGSGLPDFRTPGTGLYSQLEKYDLPSPQCMFDIEYFRENPKPFHVFARELYPGRYAPSRAHYFLRLLDTKGVLLRVYTQNVDGLETMAGVDHEKVIQCHGGFNAAHCVKCHKLVDVDMVRDAIFDDQIAHCTLCGGYAKPDIVFFGESLRGRFASCRRPDMAGAGCMLVMGTSLTVAPTCLLPRQVRRTVPRVLINREAVGDFKSPGGDASGAGSASEAAPPSNYRDVTVLGDCDDGVNRLADLLGWRAELDALVAEGRARHPAAFARSDAAVAAMRVTSAAAAAAVVGRGGAPGAAGSSSGRAATDGAAAAER